MLTISKHYNMHYQTNNCNRYDSHMVNILYERQEPLLITLNPLPEVEEDGQRDEQGGYG